MRTVLYANKEISMYLRQNFVLHWESVRPVPRITIDFGDGRVVTRTITGNAVHYTLDSQGRLLDAIPGIYGPKSFLRVLQSNYGLWERLPKIEDKSRGALLEKYHEEELLSLEKAWSKDLTRVSLLWEGKTNNEIKNVSAKEAIEVTYGKRLVEEPLLNIMTTISDTKSLKEKMNEETWRKIALLYAQESRLDASSRKLMTYQNPALTAAALTVSKAQIESPLLTMIRNFESTLAVDTIRNEYEFHSQIHSWFKEGAWQKGLVAFNERVYAEIFLTPASDPWLGLKEAVYTGLGDGGLR